MTTTTYATIDADDTILALTSCATDEQAQEWYRTRGHSTGRLVVLALAVYEIPRVGDSVTVDDDGVATLCEE